MILADSFPCTVPSTDAVKKTVLHCVGPSPNASDIWTSVASIITALATIGLVIGAFFAWRTASKTLRQMKSDSIAQTRPYVSASIVPSLGGTSAWDLIVRNTGRSAAKELTISVSKWPEDDSLIEALREMFKTPQTIAPEASVRAYWSLGDSKAPRSQVPVGFLGAVDLTISYQGDDKESAQYQTTFRLNPPTLGMTPMSSSGINLPGGSSPHDKKMAEIVRALNELRRGI